MSAYGRFLNMVNRTGGRNGRPFDLAAPTHTPRGRWGVAHFGVMVPGLPAPFHSLDAIVVLGTSRAPIFDNRPLVRTTRTDSAWWLLGSAATRDSFRCYSITDGCDLAPDGSRLRLGGNATLTRSGESVTLQARHADVMVSLDLRLTAAVSHFAHFPGIYDHWSVLCEYDGTFAADRDTFDQSGLCTYEYARAVDAPLPLRFFTYQVINVDADTQVLMVEVLGPRGLPVQRTVYLRDRSGAASVHTRGYRHTVHEQEPEPMTTPAGVRMTMPRRFTWQVDDETAKPLITINGTANNDWAYGLAAGYAGSYTYTGTFRGAPVTGTGYIEWIDRR